jgi:Flp pilus assembly protein protease CpaA
MVLDFYGLTIVAITCCVLFYVASADMQNYKIKNELVLLLAALYFIYVFATGRWNEVPSHIGVASLIFLLMLTATDCWAAAT